MKHFSNFLKQLKFGTRTILILGFMLVMLLFIGTVAITLLSFNSYRQGLEAVRELDAIAETGEQVQATLRAESLAVANMLIRHSLSLESVFREQSQKLDQELLPRLQKASLLPVEQNQLQSVMLGHNSLKQSYDKAIALIKASDYEAATTTWRIEINPYSEVALNYTTKLSNSLSERANAGSAEANDAIKGYTIWVAGALALAVVLGSLVATFTIKTTLAQNNRIRKTLEELEAARENIESHQRASKKISREVLTLAGELKVTANQQAGGSQEQLAATSQINTTLGELSMAAVAIAQAAEQVSEATRQMANDGQRIEETTSFSVEQSEQGRQALNLTIETSVEVANVYHELVAVINDLHSKNANMRLILDLLNNIASETHLLSLNAAIEAVGAGEQGERFRVLAQEIRSLAARSSKGSKDVLEIIREIETTTLTALNSAQDGYEKAYQMKQVAEESDKIIEKMRYISETAKEQATSISRRAHEVKDLTSSIKLSTEQQRLASQQVAVAMDGLVAVAQQHTSSSHQISATSLNLEEVSHNLNERLLELVK